MAAYLSGFSQLGASPYLPGPAPVSVPTPTAPAPAAPVATATAPAVAVREAALSTVSERITVAGSTTEAYPSAGKLLAALADPLPADPVSVAPGGGASAVVALGPVLTKGAGAAVGAGLLLWFLFR